MVLFISFYSLNCTWISGYRNFGIVGHSGAFFLSQSLQIVNPPRDGGLPPGRSSRRAGLSSQPHQPVNLLMVFPKAAPKSSFAKQKFCSGSCLGRLGLPDTMAHVWGHSRTVGSEHCRPVKAPGPPGPVRNRGEGRVPGTDGQFVQNRSARFCTQTPEELILP